MGQEIVLSHGIEDKSIFKHLTTPFTVVGILAPTATPVDLAVYITLLGDGAMHFGWSSGTQPAIGEASPNLDTCPSSKSTRLPVFCSARNRA
jgi:putative ABC transport system permease protein